MVFDNGFTRSEPFPDGRREWEPGNEDAFAERDPLNPENNDWGEILRSRYHPQIEFSAWSRLPAILRGQAWREREVTQFLRNESYRQRWDEQPILAGFERMGVGRRPWEMVGPPGIRLAMIGSDTLARYRQAICSGNYGQVLREYNRLSSENQQLLRWDPLAMVLSFQSPVEPAPILYGYLHLEPFQFLESRIKPLDEYGLSELVPVIIEESREYLLRSTSTTSNLLQGGQRIYTTPQRGPKSGKTIPGTLTALVEYSQHGQTLVGLLGPQHVLGDSGEPIYQNGIKIGKVLCSDSQVDVSLAELSGNPQWRREVLNRNLDPAVPLLPVSGMPAEYYGAISQNVEESYIGLVYLEPPAFYKVGKTPRFEMEGNSVNGDSGALILSGHNQQDAVSPNLARYVPSLSTNQLAAILGMLIAGDTSRRNCRLPASILATPAKDIETALLNQGYPIQWLTR